MPLTQTSDVPCPRCDGSGRWWGDKPCRMCDGAGTVHEDAASEYLFQYERESLEANHGV